MKLSWHVVGEMTLLSRIIKSHYAKTQDQEKKVIQIKKIVNEQNENLYQQESLSLNLNQQLLMEAKQKAEDIVLEAQKQAEQVHEAIQEEIKQWNDEKQKLIEEAKQEGYLIGKEQGLSDSKREYEQLLDLAKKTVTEAKKEYSAVIEKSEFTILNLGIKVAEKIMNQHLDDNKEDYLFIVKKAIKEAREYKNIELHVPPLHYEFVLTHKTELMALFPRETEFYIYPDDELEGNGCVIDSTNGRLVASVDEQLEQIRIKLVEILEEDFS